MHWLCKLFGHDFEYDPPLVYCKRCGEYKHNPFQTGAAPSEPNVPGWKLIDSHEDADTGTAFDYDSGVLDTVYNLYRVIGQFQNYYSIENDIYIRLNGNDSSNYSMTCIASDGTTSEHVDVPMGGLVRIEGNSNGIVDSIIRGGNMITDPANDYPCFASKPVGANDGFSWLFGELKVSYVDVDQIRIYSPYEMTGRLKLYGFNF